ncbi:MAG TPA: hypothetical protein PKW15_04270 [Alphaproteobacteria bacterium]|nr:hypothetical protein [Rhodospirillaceae bacterium]HRJ12444.1 hypothetical protein [Alphaproteobacteria bacterium]
MSPLFLKTPLGERGLSLLESALALAILGLIIAGIWALSGSAFGSSKKNHLAEQVIYTVESVRTYARTTDLDTTLLDTQDIWDLGLLPTDVRKAGGFRHPYGGDFFVQLRNTLLSIALDDVPSDACVDLIYSRLGGSTDAADNLGFIGYAVGSSGGTVSSNFSFNAITAACAQGPNVYLSFQPR